MSVDSINSTSGAYSQSIQSGQASAFKQRRQDFNALSQALDSGDLAGAQSAFAALQQSMQNVSQGQGGQKTGQNNVQDAMTALEKALSSGDLSGAQNAFATLKQDMQNAGQAHHHHHHHADSTQQSATTSVTTGSSASQSNSINTQA